jgi:hypothetical protein
MMSLSRRESCPILIDLPGRVPAAFVAIVDGGVVVSDAVATP